MRCQMEVFDTGRHFKEAVKMRLIKIKSIELSFCVALNGRKELRALYIGHLPSRFPITEPFATPKGALQKLKFVLKKIIIDFFFCQRVPWRMKMYRIG